MNKEIVSFRKIFLDIKAKTGMSHKEIGRMAGLEGNALAYLLAPDKNAEPKHSEGVALLRIHAEYVGTAPLMIERSNTTNCGTCSMARKTETIMRIDTSGFRCTGCIDRVANYKKQQLEESHA